MVAELEIRVEEMVEVLVVVENFMVLMLMKMEEVEVVIMGVVDVVVEVEWWWDRWRKNIVGWSKLWKWRKEEMDGEEGRRWRRRGVWPGRAGRRRGDRQPEEWGWPTM